MERYDVHHPSVHLLGRMDETLSPVRLDWTGSGFRTILKGSSLYAWMETPCDAPAMWVSVCVNGYVCARFPVEKGKRRYPLVTGMQAENMHDITLLKETQAMPFSPEQSVLVYSLETDGELLAPPEAEMRIEFIGDSLTSAEGAVGPKGNDEWLSMWFTAALGYPNIACRDLGAEMRILSQSGYGLAWDWQADEKRNMADGYDRIVGVMDREDCRKEYDFNSFKPHFICVRLLNNDATGIPKFADPERKTKELVEKGTAFLLHLREKNPESKIIFVIPRNRSMPENGRAIMEAAGGEKNGIYACSLPEYTQEDCGARGHPGIASHEETGHQLAAFIRTLL